MYIPSLDGIRAVSILIVFMAHAGWGHIVPGGFGVTVFFFLSGYLITTLLLGEIANHGRIALGAFYMRRLIRLVPPLLITLGFGIILTYLGFLSDPFDWPTIASQIFFYFNYYFLYGSANPIQGSGVFWSLSVEEHFYLIWPFSLPWLLATGKPRIWVATALLALLIWRAFRFANGADMLELYYATDTRIDSLLWGCLLAMLPRPDAARIFSENPMILWPWVGAAVGGLLISFLVRDETFRAVLRYSLQGACLMPLFHYAVTMPHHVLFRALNATAIRRIGVWSYTIYLVHFMVLQALQATWLAPYTVLTASLGGAISVVYAWAVYRLVEAPLRPLRKSFTGAAPDSERA